MVASNFAPSLSAVLKHEGGYSNHPSDPGGVTLEGIIQRVYDGYRTSKGLPKKPLLVSMRKDPAWIAERDDIYRRNYWAPSRCDDLPPGIDYATFDASVNSGVGQSAKWLQRALGVRDDGVVGDVTVAAARAAKNPSAIVQSMCDQRLAMLKGLRTWPVFGKGWSSRVQDVRRVASAMAISGSQGRADLPARTLQAEETGKGVTEDRTLTSIAKSPEGLAAGVSIGGAILNAAGDPGPLQWAIAAAVIVAVCVGAWWFIKRQRAA